MTDVRHPREAGQDPIDTPAALAAWASGARFLVAEIRKLAEDATMPRGERRQSRTFLRKMICRRLRDIEAKLDAIDPKSAT